MAVLGKLTPIALETIDIECPRWGGTLRMREMTGAIRGEWERRLWVLRDEGKPQDAALVMRSLLVALCQCNEDDSLVYVSVGDNGELAFPTAEDMNTISSMDAATLDKVFEAGRHLSKISDSDVEEIAGN